MEGAHVPKGTPKIQRSPAFLTIEKAEELLTQQEIEKNKGKQLEIKFTSLEEVPNAEKRVEFFSLVHNPETGIPVTPAEFKKALEQRFGPLSDSIRQGHLHQSAHKLNTVFAELFPGWQATVEGRTAFMVDIGNLQSLLVQYVEPVCGPDGRLLPRKREDIRIDNVQAA